MLKLNISPLARAVGVMGATAALVGGITFAALTSNTVALTDNTLATATAHLYVNSSANADPATCADKTKTSATGMSFTALAPGVESSAFNFCLGNDGDVPLDITTRIPTDLSPSTVDPTKVTMTIECGVGNSVTGTLADFTAVAGKTFTTALVNDGDDWSCTAKVKLDATVTAGSVVPFTLQFVGTQVTPPAAG